MDLGGVDERPVGRRVEVEFVADRLAAARLAQAYALAVPERRRPPRNEQSDERSDVMQTNGQQTRLARSTHGCPRSVSARSDGRQPDSPRCVSSPPSAGLVIVEELVFYDEGFSGATLTPPALERLRDRAAEGAFEVLLCHAPDRLARRYAYQVLLLEEFARAGIEVVFARGGEHSGSPEDELLRQFQGMIAEYERAQIRERTRRGKLHRARTGHQAVMAGAPYGYRFVKKTDHQRRATGRSTRAEAAGRARGVPPLHRRGRVDRRPRTLADRRRASRPEPASRCGTARRSGGCCATRPTAARPPTARRRSPTGTAGRPAPPARRGERRGRRPDAHGRAGRAVDVHPRPAARSPTSSSRSPRSAWRHNAHFAKRNTKKPTLLQGILVCRECGYAYYRTSTRTTNKRIYYYRCIGSDNYRHIGGRVCQSRPIRADELDQLVWEHVRQLLENPALVHAEIDRRLLALRTEHPAARRRETLERDLTRAGSAIDAPDRGLPRTARSRSTNSAPACPRCANARPRSSAQLDSARHRAARRRELPQARRHPRRLPRPPQRRPRPAHPRQNNNASCASSSAKYSSAATTTTSRSATRSRPRTEAPTEVTHCVGAVISPLLANVYLHYVFDLWAQQWRKRHARGDVLIVRYADDVVLGFQHRADAEQFQRDLAQRLATFRLGLNAEKTRLLRFGRFAAQQRQERGLGRPETFQFLGFTHYCTTTKDGRFLLLRKTISRRMAAKLREVRTLLMRRRHWPIDAQGRWLASVVRGHLAYYAVPGNIHQVEAFRAEVVRLWYGALRRRGQRHRLNWQRMRRYAERWLPPVRITHPWPDERFHARTQVRSPVR